MEQPKAGFFEITEADYREQLAEGIEPEFLLKPGRYQFVRGRHPNFKQGDLDPRNTKVMVSLPLDLDIFKYFEQRAAELKADSYQTMMNHALREAMERAAKASPPPDYSALLKDKRFIKAVAERVQALSSPTRKRKRSTKAKAA